MFNKDFQKRTVVRYFLTQQTPYMALSEKSFYRPLFVIMVQITFTSLTPLTRSIHDTLMPHIWETHRLPCMTP